MTAQGGLVDDDQDGLSVTVRMAYRFLYNALFFGRKVWSIGGRQQGSVERMVGSQPPPACCHASHILFYYIEDCSRGALGE